MLSAVTLSRSPPRADTTMMPTSERSRIWRHSSNPSASGSIRSSSTMSGSSVSSSLSTRMPSWETTVSNPRTARLDRIRSTMFGSSSTTRTRVLAVASGIVLLFGVGPARDQGQRSGTGVGGILLGVGRQIYPELGALVQPLQLDPAVVGVDDALRDGQAQPGPAGPGPAAAAGFERCGGQLVGDAGAVVADADHHLGPGRLGRDPDPGAGRVVTDRVVDQVDEDLFQPIVVGPDHRQVRVTLNGDRGPAGGGQGGPR